MLQLYKSIYIGWQFFSPFLRQQRDLRRQFKNEVFHLCYPWGTHD